MATAFTRALGFEAGVQLNPTVDKSEGYAGNTVAEQSVGVVSRLTRGPMDTAFAVYSSNVRAVTGNPRPFFDDHGQLVEMLSRGAKCVIVSRVVGENAKNQWVVIREPSSKGDNWGYEFALSDTLPEDEFMLAFKHLGCFSDGVKVSLSAKEVRNDSDVKQDTDDLMFKLLDKSGTMILGLYGSLDKEHVDDFGLPSNLQTIADKFNPNDIQIVLGTQKVSKDSAAYGFDSNGLQKTQVSALLFPFKEGDIDSLTATEYEKAVKRLEDTTLDYTYISSLGSDALSLLSKLVILGEKKNIQTIIDVKNDLTPKQAIAWKKQLGTISHLVDFYWHPVVCNDPNGISGRVMYGAGAYQAAKRCGRNAAINQLGFAMKEQPIAGRQFPLQRVAMKQLYKPSQDELSDLADAGINPVIFTSFANGGAYIFADVVTASGKKSSYLNLTNSVEITTSLERDVAAMAKDSFMYGPMQKAIKLAQAMVKQHLENAEKSGWLVKSDELGGNAFTIRIEPSAQRPADTMVINLQMRVEGCVRQVFITNEVTR